MTKNSIAIFGANGALGAPLLAALESPLFNDKYEKPAILITRDASGKKDTEFIRYVSGDLVADPENIAEIVKGVDVIVSLLTFSPEVAIAAEKVVSLVKPKVYIPSQFGGDISKLQDIFPGFLVEKDLHSEGLRSKGIKVVDILTNVFAGGPWIYEINAHFGIDTESKSVTYIGSPDAKVSFTHLDDVGRVIAAVAVRDPSELPDKLLVQSGVLTPAEVAKLWETRHDTKLDVKTPIPAGVALEEAKKDWAENGFQFEKFFHYSQVLIGNGYVYLETDDNEFVNPGQSLWKWRSF
ncbi:hypothetical protein PUMCH_001658 [Australozyma saopauloensis]|uniref:NmrA-like domain-containing protein n=1 Tax=Australozyma saopauloensis TaxID=291208 RepID=A0AAX4H750_9ASCO|nr:hypothetical protein PUMCH_001658 [[Candida] saopauloensis]